MGKRAKSARRGGAETAANGERKKKIRDIFVARPFEGLVDEPQWIALRELVPAASASLNLADEYAQRYPDRQVTLATILPMALPAMVRSDGHVLVGLQRHQHSGDVSRDVAAALLAALETEPGQTVEVPALPGPGPRLQDVLKPVPLAITVHEGFDFWLEETPAEDSDLRASLDRANASIYPTAAIEGVPGAYWCRVPGRAHLRLALADDEDRALAALARLSAAGQLNLGEDTRFAGMFRAHGRLIPVWDLPAEPEASAWYEAVAALMTRYTEALALRSPLTSAETRAKQGLLGRQIALR